MHDASVRSCLAKCVVKIITIFMLLLFAQSSKMLQGAGVTGLTREKNAKF